MVTIVSDAIALQLNNTYWSVGHTSYFNWRAKHKQHIFLSDSNHVEINRFPTQPLYLFTLCFVFPPCPDLIHSLWGLDNGGE